MRALRIWAIVASLLVGPCALAETIEIGAEDAWYPYSGVVKGQAQGFAVDLVQAAFAAEDITVNFVSLPYARCIELVKSGRLLGCFDTVKSSLTGPDYLWPKKPMFVGRTYIYARADSTEHDLTVKDLESKQVLVTNAFEYGDVFDSNKKILRDVSPNDTSVLRKLLAGRADYAVAYDKVVAHLIQENPKEFAGKFNIVGTVDLPELYTVFSKKFPGSAGYVEHFNRGFETISKSNRLRDIERKWDSLSPPLPVKNP